MVVPLPAAATAGVANNAPASATPADGIYRGRAANGGNVYSDSAAGLASGLAAANGARGQGAGPVGGQVGPVGTGAASAPTVTPVGRPVAQPVEQQFGYGGVTPVAARPATAVANNLDVVQGTASRAADNMNANAGAARAAISGDMLNPTGDTSEIMRRMYIDSRMAAGSPSTRRAIQQAYLGQLGALNGATAEGLQASNAALGRGAQDAATAAEGASARDLAAQQTNAQMQSAAQDRDVGLEQVRIARRPEITTAADGTMGVVQQNGTFQPVTQNGQPVRAALPPRQTGELTDGERLKSYTDRYNAIVGDINGSPEEKQAKLADLEADPLYASLRGQRAAPAAQPTWDQFLADARSKNSKMSDQQLRSYFDKNYGQ